jgi:hypothetical protein
LLARLSDLSKLILCGSNDAAVLDLRSRRAVVMARLMGAVAVSIPSFVLTVLPS